MEILILKDNQLFTIDGLDPDSEQVSLVQCQISFNQEADIAMVSPIGNLKLISPDLIQSALGSALGRDCPELREHRDYYAGFARIQSCTGEGTDNA